jgi:DNA-binding transcriptional LysR family regulator
VVLTDEGRIVAEHIGAALEAVEAAIARHAGPSDIEAFFRVITSIEESIR